MRVGVETSEGICALVKRLNDSCVSQRRSFNDEATTTYTNLCVLNYNYGATCDMRFILLTCRPPRNGN